MSETIHKKLVRDKIPAIIESAGKKAYCHTLSEDEYLCELAKKYTEQLLTTRCEDTWYSICCVN